MKPASICIIRICLMGALLLQTASLLHGQYTFKQFTRDDGLDVNRIRGVVQDRYGFIWVGHINSLTRFDGNDFVVFKHDTLNPARAGLWGNKYTGALGPLTLDKNGNLWIQTRYDEQGVHSIIRYDHLHDKFVRYETDLGDNRVHCMHIENDSVVWLGGWEHGFIASRGHGLFKVHLNNGEFEQFLNPHPDSTVHGRQNIVMDIAHWNDSLLLVGTRTGLWNFNKKTNAFHRPDLRPQDTAMLFGRDILEIMPRDNVWPTLDPAEGIWLRVNDYEKGQFMVKVNVRLEVEIVLHHGPGVGPGVHIDRKGDLWHWEDGALWQFSEMDSTMKSYSPGNEDSGGLPEGTWMIAYSDRDNNHWLYSDRGVTLMSELDMPVYYQDQISGASILYTTPSGEQLFVLQGGTDTFLGLLTAKVGDSPDQPLDLQLTGRLNDFGYGLLAGDEYMWVTSDLKGYRLLSSDPWIAQTPEVIVEDVEDFVQSIYEWGDGTIWLPSPDGLHKVARNADGEYVLSTLYAHDPLDPNSIADGMAWKARSHSDSAFWVLTGPGLDLFYPGEERFEHIFHKEVSGFCYGDGEEIYIANTSLYRGIPSDKGYQFEHLVDLGEMVFDDMVRDPIGRIWALRENGVSVYDPRTDLLLELDENDGLSFDLRQYPSLLLTESGYFILHDRDGVLRFDPLRFQVDSAANEPLLTLLNVNNASVSVYDTSNSNGEFLLDKAVPVLDEIVFDHKHNNFTFGFSSFDFTDPESIKYRYRISGYDHDWVYTDSKNRLANYMNLPSGDYTFELQASSRHGIWPERSRKLQISVLPPPWKTWWAYTLYIMAAAVMLYLLYSWRIRETRIKLAKQQELNKKLTQLDQLKDEFLANTSHELRTPLNGIIGIAESLRDGVAGQMNETAQFNLNLITASGKRLASLVNDILDFSKLKSHDIQLNTKPIDLHAAVDVVLTLSQPVLIDKRLDLINEVPRDIPLVMADENRVQQILHNLIGNAIKFTRQGSIVVSSEVQDNEVAVAVADTGIGIPEQSLGHIFESFEQGDGTTEREYGGTGIGLAITRQLVELHGGSISVESTPGSGSTFTFTLPVSDVSRGQLEFQTRSASENQEVVQSLEEGDDKDAHREQKLSSLQNEASSASARILIVDDEPTNLQVLENHLTLAGYKVDRASNGPKALEMMANSGPYDLVILDIMMPEMSGYEVCHEMRSTFLPSQLPVVMLTAKNRVSDLVDGFSAGANDYLTKPFSKDELLSRVKTHLNLHRIHRSTGKFVPYEFLKSIGRESITEARLGDNVQRKVTVMFSDIRDFTTLAEQISPEENFDMINYYAGRMGPIIRAHGGFVNQYLGDGIMAIFPDSPGGAIRASIEMQQELHLINRELVDKIPFPLRVGIGLHMGDLIMGIIGDAERTSATIVADTVNAASRMEGLTKYYGAEILASGRLIEALENIDEFNMRYLGQVQVKGKSKALGVYECFDSNSPDVVTEKIRHADTFNEGLSLFLEKEFADAARAFDVIAKSNPDDKVAVRFRNECARLMIDGVPEDWTGVAKLDVK